MAGLASGDRHQPGGYTEGDPLASSCRVIISRSGLCRLTDWLWGCLLIHGRTIAGLRNNAAAAALERPKSLIGFGPTLNLSPGLGLNLGLGLGEAATAQVEHMLSQLKKKWKLRLQVGDSRFGLEGLQDAKGGASWHLLVQLLFAFHPYPLGTFGDQVMCSTPPSPAHECRIAPGTLFPLPLSALLPR